MTLGVQSADTSVDVPARWRVTWRGALLYGALWTPLVLVYAVLIGVPNAQPVEVAVRAALETVAMAALLGLAALWWARRVGRAQLATPPASPWGAHALGALVYTSLWLTYIVVGIRLAIGDWDTTLSQVRTWLPWQAFFGVVVYAIIASVTWAMLASERTRQRDARLREAEAERARAELAVLRAKVDPHFLYNALHTATVLVRRDPSAAERALEELATLLRYVLDPARGARDMVPLDEELRFVTMYLAIERARLGDRLRVHTEVDDDARDVAVPSLSLQPLVENAIRHGIAPRAEGGTITLRSTLEGERLTLSVHDDGVGASEATVQTGGATRGTGIGLDALRKRLAARYGSRASLAVRTAPGAGFEVTLQLPVVDA
ncbi:MAG TPA: histidine kinase [Gemmatimonadaceae bacterium]|nr:histidine kinase [Gemmatimonadaceae bacterium]